MELVHGTCMVKVKIRLMHIFESSLTSRDFRYTTKDGYLCAFVMDWPKKHQNPSIT